MVAFLDHLKLRNTVRMSPKYAVNYWEKGESLNHFSSTFVLVAILFNSCKSFPWVSGVLTAFIYSSRINFSSKFKQLYKSSKESNNWKWPLVGLKPVFVKCHLRTSPFLLITVTSSIMSSLTSVKAVIPIWIVVVSK